jgi:predicted transcriptional regulator
MIGHKLKLLLNEIHHTPEEFANKIEVGKSAIYKILRGDTKKISDKMASKITMAFPQYDLEYIKKMNFDTSHDDFIKIEDQGQIEVQKIVDIIIDNYDKFESNEDFKNILDRYALQEFKEYQRYLTEKS